MSLLTIKNLFVEYRTLDGITRAVNGVNIEIERGRAVGLVGETGAGKTTAALSILGMVPDPPGVVVADEISFDGQSIMHMSDKQLQAIRGKQISMIFQDPMGSLNPVHTAGGQIMEVIRLHQNVSKKDTKDRALAMLKQVGLPETVMDQYPHELSGGMKQRVMIAIALACQPQLLIADEPTTALDVTIQAQVMEIMKNIKSFHSGAILLITHDLGLVADICDEVAIMYAGQIVEFGDIFEIFKNPQHPYTRGLFNSTPRLDIKQEMLEPISGLSPDPKCLPEGCFFYPRCAYRMGKCEKFSSPEICTSSRHMVKCWLFKKELILDA